MRIHREGRPTLIVVGIAAVVLNLLALRRPRALWLTVPASLGVWGFFARFFRDPPRRVPQIPGMVVSPADGTVVAVERVHEAEYFGDERLKVSIYMSPLNVHLNRVPLSGEVRYVRYHPGNYLVAFHPKASELNERATIVITGPNGHDVLVRQIAGFLARRIVTYLYPLQRVAAGDELGFIKFGSRCDIFLPVGVQPLVRVNQRVTGGETPIARLQ